MLRLPDDLRGAFKEPLGPLYTDAEALLADAGDPLIAVGDVVTYHLRRAGRSPDVAVIDGRTERTEVSEEIGRVLDDAAADAEAAASAAGEGGADAGESADGGGLIDVANEPATLSRELLVALGTALAASPPTVLRVDGEEDLATLPAVIAAPDGASVVYGQPGAGMVVVDATDETRAEMRGLLARMAGDHEAALDALDRGR